MRLTEEECWARLATERRAVLATLNPDGRIDAVPVVFGVVQQRRIVIPVDTIKAKTTTSLQRLHNIGGDARATLLVDHYDDDWSQLWWGRFQGAARQMAAEDVTAAAAQLAGRYRQYRDPAAIVHAIELVPTIVTGWRQTDDGYER